MIQENVRNLSLAYLEAKNEFFRGYNACYSELFLDGVYTIVKEWSRWTGTGYKSAVVKHSSGQLLQIDYNSSQSYTYGWSNSVNEIEDPSIAQRAYAAECGSAAAQYGLSFETVLAVGPANAESVYQVVTCLEQVPFEHMSTTVAELVSDFVSCEADGWRHSGGIAWDLGCGIARRKSVLVKVFPEMAELISAMGQLNSTRLANEVLKALSSSTAVAELSLLRATVKDRSVTIAPSSIDEDGCAVWSF